MTPREQAVELVAMAMWVREAERAAPNVAKSRTPEAFADAGDETRGRWIGLAHAALDALTPLLVAEDARPISTAPKYTPILIFFPEGERGRPCWTSGQLCGEDEDGSTSWWGPGGPNAGCSLDETMGGYGDGPTHWMLLPAPPKGATE